MTMHRAFALAALLLSLGVAAFAEGPPQTPAAQLEAIQKEVKEAQAAFNKAAQAIPDTPEGQKQADALRQDFDKKQSAQFMAAVELARADPKSETGFASLEWVLTIPRSYYVPAGKAALELMTAHQAANPKVGKTVAWVGYYLPEGQGASREAAAFIQAVREKNPNRDARGQAVIALAWKAGRNFGRAELKNAPETEALSAEAEKAFEAVLKDYADCPRLIGESKKTLGDEARQELFALRNLRIGKVAPEIEGEDVAGVKLKLSQYRGKVVVLDFWGNW